jgi:hypothetical protein
MSDTPETDKLVRTYLTVIGTDAIGMASKLTLKCEKLERERDGLLKNLNVLAYWRDISECDCNDPLPNGGCLRCDLDNVFNTTNQND